jgi:2-iminobutanoate/2-iminopropanoate deaminase
MRNLEDRMKERIHSPLAPEALGPYSQAIRVGNLVFTAGQIGIDPETGELKEGVRAQTEQVMRNLMEVLKASGMSRANVVKTTIFLDDMNDFAEVNEIYGSFLEEPYPARSTVAVKTSPKGALVEIEMIAGD